MAKNCPKRLRHSSSNSHTLKKLFFSQNVTSDIVERVVEEHAKDVLDMKAKVEENWEASSCKRIRRTTASASAPGYSLYGDNVG